jgi:hypothetical protein
MTDLTEFAQRFKSPPATYRPTPQWSWNGELTEARITEQLEQFVAQGSGGLFTHARPGLITPYMSSRWLELWGFALQEAARLGMDFHIYDEFMCPAGHAGGLVIAAYPHLALQELTLDAWMGPGHPLSGETMAFFQVTDTGAVVSLADNEARRTASPQHPVLVLVRRTMDERPGLGGFPGPDLTLPEAAEAFIATTHAQYAQHWEEYFGEHEEDHPGGVRFMFSDEPYILGRAGGLPLSNYLLKEFYHDHGYALETHLEALCFAREDSAPIRAASATKFDYWWTVNRLFNANFMQPMATWCEEHDLLFTGHLMEHEWPSPRSHPSAMAALRWMHAPGADLLGFQFEPTTPEKNGLYLLNLLEIRSVKQQLGRRWMLVETCGGAGYETAFEIFKPLEDLVLAFGFNVIDPHLGHQTLAGMRKYDWPQTLTDHSPWWAYYRPHADHVARVNAALSQGEERQRVLVLHPTTSAWLYYTAPAFQIGDAANREDKLAAIRQSQVDLLLALYGNQVDFDLGDELIMESLGRVEDGKLVVGACAYDAVVLPPAMENWTAATLQLMKDYLDAGGRLYALRPPPVFVNGRESGEPATLADRYAARWHTFADTAALLAALRQAVPPPITAPDGGPLPASLCWRRVDLGDGAWLTFFCNPWGARIQADVRLEGRALKILDTASGNIRPLSTQTDGEPIIAHLDLPPRGHALWLCESQPLTESTPAVLTETTHPVALELLSAERLSPNLLMLDYCDMEAYGRTLEDVNTLHADDANWRWQGFDGNPWFSHPFKRTVIDRPIDPDSACLVRYTFVVAEDVSQAARDTFKLGIERPWLYDVRLNGTPLPVESAPRWFDEAMQAVLIGEHVRPGENVLTLEARPFHILCEIMPVYLIGDFALEPVAQGFRVEAARPLALGDWTQQGLPFYPDIVRYAFNVALEENTSHIRLSLDAWAGSVVAVWLDGAEAGVVMHPPFTLDIAMPLEAGQHTLDVDVVGIMKNMMGPHHAEGLPGAWTWRNSPSHQPLGIEYRRCPSGLLTMPSVAWVTT